MSYPPGPPQSQYHSLLQSALPPHQSSHSSAPPPLPPLPPASQQAQWSSVGAPSLVQHAHPASARPQLQLQQQQQQQQQVTGISNVPDYTKALRGVSSVSQAQHGAPPSPIPSPAPSSPGPASSNLQGFVPPGLQSKNRQELAALARDDETLTAMFEATHPASTQHAETISALTTQVKQTAARISEKEQAIADARARAEEELKDAREMDAQWRAVEKRMYDSIAPYSAGRLRAKLGSATAEAEHVSEALAGSFLDTSAGRGGYASAGVDVGQFVREYRRVRRIYHLRKERVDRWNEERVGGAGRVR
ncbi:hypothetical protein V1517DRAFT_203096 [Lipomyces orientalis]|uniref:Uncharacterized protein n=1 Tax=Lipomyces orientalis TaxID=1233043 RepID=A0ACC3TVK8_9ASCO